MPLNITSTDNYILMESSTGIDYWEIMEGISNLFSMPEFKNKNDIWLFRDGHLKIMYSDLYSIKDMVVRLYPPDSKGKKRPSLPKPVSSTAWPRCMLIWRKIYPVK